MNPEPEARYHVPVDLHAPYPARGRPQNTERRVSIVRKHNAKLEPVFIAQVRGPNERTYIGAYDTEAEARTDAQAFIETGKKPEPKKVGAKLGSKPKARKYVTPRVSYSATVAKPLATAERLARTTKRLPNLPASMPLAQKTPLTAQVASRWL